MLLFCCEFEISSPDFQLFSNLFSQTQKPGKNPGLRFPCKLHGSPRCLHVPVKTGHFWLTDRAPQTTGGRSLYQLSHPPQPGTVL